MASHLRRNTSKFGKLAEDFAVKFLLSKGYKVVDRNFHSRFGEIDVVAIKNDFLIFVEVKARWNAKFGAPIEAVTASKIWKISRTGEYYSLIHPELPKRLKITVVSLIINDGKIVSSKIIEVD